MLLTVLSLLRNNWRLVLAGFVVLGCLCVWWFIGHQARTIKTLEAQLSTVEQAAQDNAKALAELRAQSARDLAAVAADRDATLQKLKTLNTIRGEIARAPESDDAPVAPVLRRAVDSLRRAPGAGPAR